MKGNDMEEKKEEVEDMLAGSRSLLEKVLSNDQDESDREVLAEDYFKKFLLIEFNIPNTGISLKNILDEFENALILKVLHKTGWNKKKAANLLNLKRTTLVQKIKRKNLSPFHLLNCLSLEEG